MLAETLPIPRFFAGLRNSIVAFCGATRIGRAILGFLRHFFGSIARAIHILSLQIVGCFFALFAMFCWNAAVLEYRHYSLGQAALNKVLLTSFLALLFTYFAVSSFARAKRKELAHKAKQRTA